MRQSILMQTKYPSLTKEDCALMLENLDESLAVFDRKQGGLSGAEIRVKSLLSALRMELIQHLVQLGVDE